MADARNILASQLERYNLCKSCYERHGTKSRIKQNGPCCICRGLMDNIDSTAGRMLDAVREYEFHTFLIGAMLPTQIYEREDAMRARLKIRGRESIKNQLTRELGIIIARSTKKKVEYFRPDLTISLVVDKENNVDVTTQSRALSFAGRYTKKAPGFPQKQGRCPSCEGKGCASCKESGLSGYQSVEGVIAKELMSRTHGRVPKFSWIGSEDQSSLVLGTGRPFYARISDPRKRKLGKISIREGPIRALLLAGADIPETQMRFTVKTRIHVKCERNLATEDLTKLKSLAGTEVSFQNRTKLATKKIYSASVRQTGAGSFFLTINADGGLMIKQFVGGEEYMKPSISELLKSKCECVTFDILDVSLQ